MVMQRLHTHVMLQYNNYITLCDALTQVNRLSPQHYVQHRTQNVYRLCSPVACATFVATFLQQLLSILMQQSAAGTSEAARGCHESEGTSPHLLLAHVSCSNGQPQHSPTPRNVVVGVPIEEKNPRGERGPHTGQLLSRNLATFFAHLAQVQTNPPQPEPARIQRDCPPYEAPMHGHRR
jgi:hypothetical protein